MSFPDSGIRTCGTALGTARILEFAGEPLTLAPAAGRRNENPVGESHRREQRAEPLQQLPTCTHIAFFRMPRPYFAPEHACYSLCQGQTSFPEEKRQGVQGSNPRLNG